VFIIQRLLLSLHHQDQERKYSALTTKKHLMVWKMDGVSMTSGRNLKDREL
jgi:hypothetical protein